MSNIMDDREDYNNRSAVHDAMEHFTYHWAPAQPRKAAEFPSGFFQAPIAPAKVEVKE